MLPQRQALRPMRLRSQPSLSASLALDRAGFKIIPTGLQQCALDADRTADADRADLEPLFLSLA